MGAVVGQKRPDALPGKAGHDGGKSRLGQPGGQHVGIPLGADLHPAGEQAGPVGQPRPVKVGLGLGQIDADAQDPCSPVGHALAQDAHDLFAVQQQVVGPLDAAVDAVHPVEHLGGDQAGQKGQRLGLDQGLLHHAGVVQRLSRRVDPGVSPASPPGGLAGGVHRAEFPQPSGIALDPAVGAVHRVQPDQRGAHFCTCFHSKWQTPFSTVMTP